MDFFTADTDLFEALGIKEEWEEEEISDSYAEQDARTLKEYGFSSTTPVVSLYPSLFWWFIPLSWLEYPHTSQQNYRQEEDYECCSSVG